MAKQRDGTDAAKRSGRALKVEGLAELALAGLLALAGCATAGPTTLFPAPGHALVGGSSLAVEGQSGVSITADGNAWQGWPQNLPADLTPIWVTVRNNSDEPLRIRYGEFRLEGQSGAAYQALAPYGVLRPGQRQQVTVPNPGYFQGFYVADYLAPYYPWLPVWRQPLGYGPRSYSVAWGPRMPTVNMIDQALPEGVLAPGGQASGFLYFQKVGGDERAVTFRADLHAVPQAHRPAQRMAAIDIPFRVMR